MVRSLTRISYNAHTNQITQNLTQDQKPFWPWLKNVKGGCHIIPVVYHHGNIFTSALDEAKAFNSFDMSVFTKDVTSAMDKLRLKAPVIQKLN